jgi:hypothetical protein
MGTPNLKLLDFLIQTFNINTFVETGTCHGETIEKVVTRFKEIHTVELSDELFQNVASKFGATVSCRHGFSVEFLKELLPYMGDRSVIYWLDAHYSGGPSAGEHAQCSLLDEIHTINNSRIGNADFILIDDAHVFFSPAALKPPFDAKQWPSLTQIFDALNEKKRYTIILSSWQMGERAPVMPEDVIVSVPWVVKDALFNWLLDFELIGLPV